MTVNFDRTFDPAHGKAVQLLPWLRRITAPNAGPFTFHGTNTYLIGGRSVIVVDPGPDDPAHIEAILAAVGDGAVSAILLTHGHRDHSAAAPALAAATGAPVAASPALSIGPPNIALDDGATLDTEAGTLRAIATPGHTADHLAFAVEGSGQLLSGDHVMAWSTSVIAAPDGSMADYFASLEKIAARPESTYWPGHGGPARDGPRLAASLRTHRLIREAMIVEALKSGADAVETIVAAVYVGLDPALAAAAGQSVLAHLDWLIAKGAVVADAPSDGAAGPRYRLAG